MPKYAPDFWRNNYLDMSAAAGSGSVWQTMGATAKPAGEAQEGGGNSAYDTYKGLLTLAKSHAAASGQAAATKGTCKRCGAAGHLTFQCRNHLSSTPKAADTASGLPGKWEMPSSTSSVSSEDPGPADDSDAGDKTASNPEGMRGRGKAHFTKDETYYRDHYTAPPMAPDNLADDTDVVFIPEPLKRSGHGSSDSSTNSSSESSTSSSTDSESSSDAKKKSKRKRKRHSSSSDSQEKRRKKEKKGKKTKKSKRDKKRHKERTSKKKKKKDKKRS